MEQKSHIITEQVFGSSRKIQFIGLTPITTPTIPTPTNTNTNTTTTPTTTQTNTINTETIYTASPMDSLLCAIDQIQSTTTNNTCRLDINKKDPCSSTHQTMSIKSLLATNNNSDSSVVVQHKLFNHHRQSQSASMNDISIASLLASDDITSYKRRWNLAEEEYKHTKKYHKKPTINQRTTLTCFHATVAQKSYGTEKRFLCPPPIVHIASNEKYSKKIQLSMSVICENGGKILEQRSMLDENQSGSFKYLHVTGTAKAKHFYLKVNLLPITKNDHLTEESLASFISKPISIISKPSKKTAKTRNISTCILAHSTVSLFNRINSQTVRTKYMTSSNNMLCAKNSSWSPFNIIIVNQPNLPHSHKLSSKQHDHFTSRIQLSRYSSLSNQQDNVKIPHHLTYGTEIILKDAHTGVTSPSLIIRKVDKGRIIQSAYGPVSQMQKIALQLASTVHTQQPIYLSASGSIAENNNGGELDNSTSSSINHSTWLDYSPSKMVQSGNNSPISYEEVDDYLCWTIVGINKFEYEYDDDIINKIQQQEGNEKDTVVEASSSSLSSSSSNSTSSSPLTPNPLSPSLPRHITPLPLLTSVEYQYNHHTLNVVGQHLIQAAPVPRLLDLWLGTHGPLLTRLSQPPQPHKPHEIHWSVQLPSTRDLLAANHDLIMTKENKKSLELTLLLVRQQDGMVYHTGKALLYSFDRPNHWSVVSASSSLS